MKFVQGYIVYAYFDLNVYFFQNSFRSHFFWQIWSQNVKFFKLTKIWYIGRFYCLFFQIFCHSYSFRQIWSQNLKFFKLTEMSYFDVYFFKILVIHIFGANLVPTNWSSPYWLKFGAALHYYMLIMILMLIFSKHFVIHIVLGKFGSKAVLPINWYTLL